MPDESVEQFINRLNDICARMVNDPGSDEEYSRVFATNSLHLPRLRQDGICSGRNTAPSLKIKHRSSPTFRCFATRGSK